MKPLRDEPGFSLLTPDFSFAEPTVRLGAIVVTVMWECRDSLEGDCMKYTIVMLSIICIAGAGTCLAVDKSICNPGSEITYYSKGQLQSCSLENDFAINGVNCKQSEMINLYENGMLKSCATRTYFKYGNITCNQFSQVSFYETGALSSCDLASQVQIDGKTCAQLQPIFLFEDGKLKSCSMPD